MDIVYLGHSSFRLHADGMVVVTDPFPPSLGLRMDPRPAAVVTVSNHAPQPLGGRRGGRRSAGVLGAGGEYEYNGIVVRGVMTPLPAGVPHERRNVAYTIEMDGVNLCHLGDLALPLTTRQVDELKPVDVVMAPAGGHAISPDQVLQTIQDLDPRIVIPMHFAQGQAGLTLQGPETFLRRLGQGRGAAAAPAGGHHRQPARRPAGEPADAAPQLERAGRRTRQGQPRWLPLLIGSAIGRRRSGVAAGADAAGCDGEQRRAARDEDDADGQGEDRDAGHGGVPGDRQDGRGQWAAARASPWASAARASAWGVGGTGVGVGAGVGVGRGVAVGGGVAVGAAWPSGSRWVWRR